MSFWEKISSLDRRVLYALLFILVGIFVIKPITVKNTMTGPSKSLFDYVNSLKEGDVVLVESDWTNSTRGESRGQFKALMRLLMRKKIKFVLTSIDQQAPNVARIEIQQLAEEPGNNNYKINEDYAIAGYFSDAYNHVMGLVNNIRKELAGKGVTATPVMNGINDLRDVKCVIVITASSSSNVWYQRMRNKTKLGLMCTAVMSAEAIPYYASGQLVGIAIGAKGGFDFETMLQETFGDEGGKTNFELGQRYMTPLAFALGLLIFAVIIGNIAMVVTKKQGERE